jgi:hypothetical protein
MKILFLDIDGVLNNRHTNQSFYCNNCKCVGVKPELLDLLKIILDSTDAEIVISSTWREHEECMDYLKRMMGKRISSKIIGYTPSLYFRKDEIDRWFENNKTIKIERFVVLDDLEDEGLEGFGDNFVQTNRHIGLTEELADKCIEILNRV